MIICADFACLVQDAYANAQYEQNSLGAIWTILGMPAAFAAGFVLMMRKENPEIVFWLSCLFVTIFPFDSLLVLMALASLLARRVAPAVAWRSIPVAIGMAIWAQLRDVGRKPEASFWYQLFARPGTGASFGVPPEVDVSRTTIVVFAATAAVISTLIAVLLGIHIRSRALARAARAMADAARDQVGPFATT